MIYDYFSRLYPIVIFIGLILTTLVIVNFIRNYMKLGVKRTGSKFHTSIAGYYFHMAKVTALFYAIFKLIFDEELQPETIYYNARAFVIIISCAALIMLLTDFIFQWWNKRMLKSISQ